ncbi:MAG: four helix bundle protein [Elusimicrobiota bacterium]
MGSCAELETQLLLAKDLKYISVEESEKAISLVNEVNKMLIVLTKKLKSKP